MNYKNVTRYILGTLAVTCMIVFAASASLAQEKAEGGKPAASRTSGGRDPFKRYQPVIKPTKAMATKLEPPSIQVRIDRYRAQKLAAANAHVAAPKPTTALLLNEVQVTGIFRTPRGWSAMVEATPLNPKLSYVVYPGESFFDGQLVAIEESRLVFRRDTVWTDGRKERGVEIKPLRQPSMVEAMTAAKAGPTESSASESVKPTAPEKQ
jgi:hypothetical protein